MIQGYKHKHCNCVTKYICVQVKARKEGLWNLFLPAVSGLTQLDYAYIAEETGRCLFAPEVFNCQAPGKTLHDSKIVEAKKSSTDILITRSCFAIFICITMIIFCCYCG